MVKIISSPYPGDDTDGIFRLIMSVSEIKEVFLSLVDAGFLNLTVAAEDNCRSREMVHITAFARRFTVKELPNVVAALQKADVEFDGAVNERQWILSP